MSEDSGGGGPVLRGIHLRQLGRNEEAEASFREALAREPDNPDAHLHLALCLDDVEGQRKQALASVDRAIELDPEVPLFHAVRASVLGGLRKGDAALEAAERAVGLDPNSALGHCTVARAQLVRQRWAEAEQAARKALATDGDDTDAQGILAVALRMQGKREEDEIAVGRLLAENPDDKFTHLNAGWSALRRFDHRGAEGHFLESLRLDPEFEPARDGLLESFRARSRFYRLYQRYCFWMARFTSRYQWVLLIGLIVGLRLGREILAKIHPALAGLLVGAYVTFVFWVWLARGIGSFLVFCDRSARHALRRSEKVEALAVGGAFTLGMLLLIGGAALGRLPMALAGGTLAIGALPAALTFTNESKTGRLLFGSVFGFVYCSGFGAAITAALGSPLQTVFAGLSVSAVVAVALCTWLGNLQVLRR